MDAADQFAAEATLFEKWAVHGTAEGHAAAREALLRITRLYLAALALPPAWSEEADGQDAVSLEDSKVLAVRAACGRRAGGVRAACGRLPLDHYGEVFDPLVDPPEEPVLGSLSDDIADIYHDVVTGLNEYRAGRRALAVWEWAFGLGTHWGEHATGAIRALHCWLAANGFDPGK